jgi:serine phosphatase RsbU (regulator of sigma subunit)
LDNALYFGVINQLYGDIYIKLKKWNEANHHLKQAEKILAETKNIYYLKNVYYDYYLLHQENKNFRVAFHYYKKFIYLNDSIGNEENNKKSIITDLKYNHEKEQAIKEKEHQKQLAIEKEKLEKQKITTRFIIAGLVLVLLFSGFIVNRLQVTRKQKRIIENQKQLVEEQKKVVEEQKLIVEQKNKDITDSIKYSKRIQDAILPHPQKWKEYLPESFILYLPKDIVAGDFYWMEVLDNYIYVAAADCTGHGVPGAMVSVVCSHALTKAVLEEKITNTDEILNRVREIVIEKLTSEENIRDGMDICLIRLTKGTKEVQYSGANRPLYIESPVAEYETGDSGTAGTEATDEGGGFDSLRYTTTAEDQKVAEYETGDSETAGTEATGMQLTELKPDKQPVGRYEAMKPFSRQEIVLQKNSILYLTTDGYADQFGGEKGKKIGTKVFKELLKENSRIGNSEKRREHLLSYFQRWKGDEEQMDDVTIIQIRIKI